MHPAALIDTAVYVAADKAQAHEIARLNARCEALEEENLALTEQLRGLLADDDFAVPAHWHLTTHMRAVLNFLNRRRGPVSHHAMHTALYGLQPNGGPDLKICNVWVCKLRERLDPLGIAINTVWGYGYELDAPNRAKLKALADEALPVTVYGHAT